MPDISQTNPACDLRGIREAVCVHTDKITDSCLAKDCIEDLHVYLTVDSQCALDSAAAARARYVELLHVDVRVESVPYSTGYYTVDVTFYYRVIADATISGSRTNTISGLAVFSKRIVLYGGDTTARSYSSKSAAPFQCKQPVTPSFTPEGIAEVVDPIILGSRVQEVGSCGCCCPPTPPELPENILACFDQELVLSGECKRLLVTVGQFSITRLQRSTQLLIPTFDYCVPTKSCPTIGAANEESPCQVFSQIDFPMDAFFPGKNDVCIPASESCTKCSRVEE